MAANAASRLFVGIALDYRHVQTACRRLLC
ncbi:MAG: hypothetical protein WDN02_12805 [Methylovirgula sp.]